MLRTIVLVLLITASGCQLSDPVPAPVCTHYDPITLTSHC